MPARRSRACGEDTYRTHDGRLPVKLWALVSMLLRTMTFPEAVRRRRISRKNRAKCDVPDHLRWGQPSRTTGGHYTQNVSERSRAVLSQAREAKRRLFAPRIAGSRASKQRRRRGQTYRPRSVSSLLMRLRAMALCVLWVLWCVVERAWCWRRVSGVGC